MYTYVRERHRIDKTISRAFSRCISSKQIRLGEERSPPSADWDDDMLQRPLPRQIIDIKFDPICF